MMDARLVAFGRRVRDIRVELGLSQEELAAKAGIDRTYISGIERGVRNISMRKLFQIADALKVDVCVFFEEK
jgi:transcriptional regulator with XRE-family HTH domain